MSLLVKIHIWIRANALHKIIEVEIDKYLKSVVAFEFLGKNKIIFSGLLDLGSKTINACTFLSGIIVVNAEWAARLILFQDIETKQAFLLTVGHELTHLENDYKGFLYFGKDRKFIKWVNEVHADFGAARKVVANSRAMEISALAYKQHLKGNKDKDRCDHPSWKRRKAYIMSYNFNAVLIEQIARDSNCRNKKLIKKVCDHFEEITLMDNK